jgi:hypothetical protein
MNFFLQALLSTFTVGFARAADLQVNAPVSFGLSLSDEVLDVVTISAMVGIIVIPLIIGLIYAKVLISRLRLEMKKKPSDDTEEIDSFSYPAEVSQNNRTFQTRLTDMKTNAVLRLWWKKQHKIHGVALIEADVEAQTRTMRSQLTDQSGFSKKTQKTEKSEKSDKHVHSHHKHKKKKEEIVSP